MANVECEVCGGNDFYKESGHYYCKECQTQTQEIQEHVFDQEITNTNKKNTKKIKNPTNKTDNKITSWECYNIILCSFTKQLINLGADPKLKPVVKSLWMLYLEKLDVIKNDSEMPKLPITKHKKDAAIIYGFKTGKRRRRVSTSTDGTVNTSLSIKQNRSRKKKALAESQLEELSQRSLQDSTSLHNETLTSLKSSSDKSSSLKTKIYNKYAVKELRRRMAKKHAKKHLYNHKLTCHKITQANCSYQYSVTIITPMKLYSLLYLGLLINKDPIQLGDLLNFINEGHLSFNYYSDLFPEEYHDKFLNFNNHTVNSTFSSLGFRKAAASLANLLGIHKYITAPDLVDLCRRYCKELNLPDTICNCAINLIIKSCPKMNFVKKQSKFPNYEGRVMAIILVVLKLLFGLDDATEYEFSKYAFLCNQYENSPKMFSIIHWLKYLEYRFLILNEYHFPTQLVNDKDHVDSDIYLQYVLSKPKQYNEDCSLTKHMEEYKQLLIKLKNSQETFLSPLEFSPSLIRSHNYCNAILKSFSLQNKGYMNDILEWNFADNSVEFLIKPNQYLELINQGKPIKVENGGVNRNWIFNDIKTCIVDDREQSRKEKALVTVKLTRKNDCIDFDIPKKNEKDSKFLLDSFLLGRQYALNKNKSRMYKQSNSTTHSTDDNFGEFNEFYTHYHPFETYWMNYKRYIDCASKVGFNQFFSDYPCSFQLIFNEITRILEQNKQEFFLEFQLTEAYLVNVAKFRQKDEPRKIQNIKLKNIVLRAKKNW